MLHTAENHGPTKFMFHMATVRHKRWDPAYCTVHP